MMRRLILTSTLTVLLSGMVACSPDAPSGPEAIVDAQIAAVADAHTPPLSDMPPMPDETVLEDIDFTAYSRDLAKYTDLKEGLSRVEAVENVRLYFAPDAADTILKTKQSVFEREDGAVMIFSAEGFSDEYIKAEEIYLILTGPKGNQTLASYGSRIKCYRGENTTQWQTKACP